jgi:hypothetical protein
MTVRHASTAAAPPLLDVHSPAFSLRLDRPPVPSSTQPDTAPSRPDLDTDPARDDDDGDPETLLVIGCVEWQDSGDPPTLVVGWSLDPVLARIAERLAQEDYFEDRTTLTALPAPDYTDPNAVRAWLMGVRDRNTVPWWTIYRCPHPGRELAEAVPQDVLGA